MEIETYPHVNLPLVIASLTRRIPVSVKDELVFVDAIKYLGNKYLVTVRAVTGQTSWSFYVWAEYNMNECPMKLRTE